MKRSMLGITRMTVMTKWRCEKTSFFTRIVFIFQHERSVSCAFPVFKARSLQPRFYETGRYHRFSSSGFPTLCITLRARATAPAMRATPQLPLSVSSTHPTLCLWTARTGVSEGTMTARAKRAKSTTPHNYRWSPTLPQVSRVSCRLFHFSYDAKMRCRPFSAVLIVIFRGCVL